MKNTFWFLSAIILAIAKISPAIEFSNSIFVTTNLVFFLNSEKDFRPQVQFESSELIYDTIAATGTNTIFYRAMPFKQAFDFKLLNDQGQEILKTKSGLDYSQKPIPPKSRYEINRFRWQGVKYEPRALFRPDEMFLITNKGIYKLQVRLRICIPATTNGLPNTELMTSGTNVAFAQEYSMVVSDPVCVKVVKE